MDLLVCRVTMSTGKNTLFERIIMKIQKFLKLMLLAFLSAITAEAADKTCGVYMYPSTDKDIAGYQVHSLPKKAELIYKVFEVSDDGKLVQVMDHSQLREMGEKFRDFRHTWLVDKSFSDPSVGVDDSMQPDIVALQEALRVFKPARMSLDLEPIVREDGQNLMPFHARLIREINNLELPVSVYLGCSKLIGAIDMQEYQSFQDALKQPGNSVILDAYCWGRQCKHGNACGRGVCINDGEGQCVVTSEAPLHNCLMHLCDDTHDNYTNPETLARCVEELVTRQINFQLALMVVRKPTTEEPWVYRNEEFLETSMQRAQSRGLADLQMHELYLGTVFFHVLHDDPVPTGLISLGKDFCPGLK